MTRTYSFGFLVGGGQFITLVLQTTQLQFQFVQATVQLVDDALGLMQIIYRKELISDLWKEERGLSAYRPASCSRDPADRWHP